MMGLTSFLSSLPDLALDKSSIVEVCSVWASVEPKNKFTLNYVYYTKNREDEK
jgi:hypothetical protein